MIFAYSFLNMITWFSAPLLYQILPTPTPSVYLKYSVDEFLPRCHVTVLPPGAGVGKDLGLGIVILCHKVAEELTLPKGNLVLGQR